MNKRGRPPVHDHSEFMRLYNAGCNDCEIARQTGADPSTVHNWRTRRGLPVAETGPWGRPSNVRKPHFCRQRHKIERARAMRKGGLTIKAIAAEFDVCPATVSRSLRDL